ncbi:DEAD/DEAH box helicase [Deinococcus fonticola]|uniref:DEAD/DEAH box helicase n=1 Tax=Deinococcus fonticola TaxID=2528713 RepID=UPI00142F8664|nr:DEAD/DEAH box helicase [Deinococcus fonticola]
MTPLESTDIQQVVERAGWQQQAEIQLPARPARRVATTDLPCSEEVRRYLARTYPQGIYRHQAQAAVLASDFESFAVTTGTASGKTLCFHLAAMELLTTLPGGKVIVLYPQKALGAEQEQRWREALREANISARVGRIDGSVNVQQREEILRDCRVVILTPDVMHAWLLSNLAKRAVAQFVRDVRLIIADEVHTFTGVFGSNAAYLMRRFEHASKTLSRKRLQFVCASATLADPAEHLRLLFGRDFTVIGPAEDGSPKAGVSLHFLKPQGGVKDLLSGASNLLRRLSQAGVKFLCFTDSRKQTENLASIVARQNDPQAEDSEENAEEVNLRDDSTLARLKVLPYRSGYEARDRDEIQRRLSEGQLDGVISTSALELGMDIPYLDAVVLVGVPTSSTSFYQRIGRVGRRKPGRVFILHTGSPTDDILFQQPEDVLNRPPATSALYLENPNIQCIHALCLAQSGGEHESLLTVQRRDVETDFTTPIEWPAGFLDIVARERSGTLPQTMQSLKTQAGEDPHHAFPLRDVESSFQVEVRHNNEPFELGSLSYSQVMREAYPGAVYLYMTRAFRITKVHPVSRRVQARPEKRYSTKPICLPTLAYPNLEPESVTRAECRGLLTLVDCDVMIAEKVIGFSERRGNNEFSSPYPLDAHQTGIYFQHSQFTRNFYSTGVVLHHPLLQADLQRQRLADLILEAFGIEVPFERRDIGITADRLRLSQPGLDKGAYVLVVYDQTYGSLRLSARLMEDGVLEKVLGTAAQLAQFTCQQAETGAERDAAAQFAGALTDLYRASQLTPHIPAWSQSQPETPPPGELVQVIVPGSQGICVLHDNREMNIQDLYYHPRKGLHYKGRLITDSRWDTSFTVVPVEGVQPIPGVSELGWYDLDLGELTQTPAQGTAV